MPSDEIQYNNVICNRVELFCLSALYFLLHTVALKQELLIIYKQIMNEEVRVEIWLQSGIVNLN